MDNLRYNLMNFEFNYIKNFNRFLILFNKGMTFGSSLSVFDILNKISSELDEIYNTIINSIDSGGSIKIKFYIKITTFNVNHIINDLQDVQVKLHKILEKLNTIEPNIPKIFGILNILDDELNLDNIRMSDIVNIFPLKYFDFYKVGRLYSRCSKEWFMNNIDAVREIHNFNKLNTSLNYERDDSDVYDYEFVENYLEAISLPVFKEVYE